MFEFDDGSCFWKLPLTKEDLLILSGLANERNDFGCDNCSHRSNECDCEYSSDDWPYCNNDDKQHMNNLKGFPFKNVPKSCKSRHFILNYWENEFVSVDMEFSCSSNNDKYKTPLPLLILMKASDNFGKIKLNDKNKIRVQEALDKFKNVKNKI